MRYKQSLRQVESFIHNPGDKFNVIPWVHLILQDSTTNIIPGRHEKFIDYNDNEHFIIPFKMDK